MTSISCSLPTSNHSVIHEFWSEKRSLDVIVIEGLRIQSQNKTSTHNAQYCSLFFKPWTLRKDSIVPHLSLLDLDSSSLLEWHASQACPDPPRATQRLTKKTTQDRLLIASERVCWKTAQDEYVRHNVASAHAVKLITIFLQNAMTVSDRQAASAKECGKHPHQSWMQVEDRTQAMFSKTPIQSS